MWMTPSNVHGRLEVVVFPASGHGGFVLLFRLEVNTETSTGVCRPEVGPRRF